MKKGYGINVGSSSVLMIFVLLSLTAFSALSLVSARADLRLTQKAADSVSRYYEANAAAQALLGDCDRALQTGAAGALDAADYAGRVAGALMDKPDFFVLPSEAGAQISFEVPVDEKRVLQVSLTAPFSDKDAALRYRLDAWQVTQVGQWAMDDGQMNLWSGDLPQIFTQ
jgi:hypothetical protein